MLRRFWEDIAARPDGPFAFRFYLQPLMSILFAVRDGVHDANTGEPPYFWQLLTDRSHRRALGYQAWKSVGKVFGFAALLDVIYQFRVIGAFRPIETLFIATTLAVVPYLLMRGTVNRIVTAIRRVRVH